MTESIKFEKSSGNVFLDIGFSQEEAERELLQSNLAFEVYNILKERKLTRTEVGRILGIDQSDLSRQENGDFHRFSVEHLSALLNKLNRNIEIGITLTVDTKGK